MKKTVDFCHKVGRHCGSTAIRDLMEFHGINLSEPVCFGIGQGLGIWYLKDIPDAPTILFHGRCYQIEANFFENMGIFFKWEQFKDKNASIDALIDKIDHGVPVLIQSDIYYLPYFNSSTHFPGHAVVVWGYDDQEMMFFISDTEKEKLLKVSFEDLSNAMFFKGFFKGRGNQFGPFKIEIKKDLKEVIKKSIFKNSYEILYSQLPYSGISALEMWLNELNKWEEFNDWKWCARFTYQIIEKRGTGGGAFRLMYSEFLEEVSDFLPVIKKENLHKLMGNIGIKWQELAYTLKEISESKEPDFSGVQPYLQEIMELEHKYHSQVVRLLG